MTEALELSDRKTFSYLGFPITKKLSFIGKESVPTKVSINCYGRDKDSQSIMGNKQSFPQINWEQVDLFDPQQTVLEGENIIITNPPYNKRLKTNQSMRQMVDAMIREYSPLILGIIVPKDQISQLNLDNYKLIDFINFRNGGFPCQFMIFKRD